MLSELYIGLMSGTSMDGVDAALVAFDAQCCKLLASDSFPYPADLHTTLQSAIVHPDRCGIDSIGTLDQWVGECFRDAALSILAQSGYAAKQVLAIGSHGQTLRHRPDAARPYTMQIGDPNLIAAGTGIRTVADFRRRDMAGAGEGAPLTPAFHQWLFADANASRAVVNIGGIANVTHLPAAGGPVIGFDTGPGNTLMDGWIRQQRGQSFDDCGHWAASGKRSDALLRPLLEDPYFAKAPPKSTGFEHFNLAWLAQHLQSVGVAIDPADVQASLCALTASSIADAIEQLAPEPAELLVCGGGSHNTELMTQLTQRLPGVQVNSTMAAGLDPDWVEACAFAWLAQRCCNGQPGNLPSVTGANRPAVLGGIYHA